MAQILTMRNTNDKNSKFKSRSKGVREALCDLLLEFWDSLHISGTFQARNLKSGTNVDHEGH